jgi:tetratricopeptide (TPR) repeat protein
LLRQVNYQALSRMKKKRLMHHRLSTTILIALALSFSPPGARAQGDLWSVYFNAGMEARQKGDYRKAEELLGTALKEAENGKKSDSQLSQTLNSLAVVLVEAGKPEGAEPLLKRVLSIEKAKPDADSLDLARTMSNLAECLRQQGKLSEAEPLSRSVLATVEKRLGKDDLAASLALNNLSMILQDQFRYEESEPLMRQSLSIRERKLGHDNRSVATVLNNLATSSYRQGKYTDAESLFKRALSIFIKELGPDHPDTALCLSNLAAVGEEQGEFAEAETLYRQALAAREKSLGSDNPQVGETLNKLAFLLARQKRYSEAEPLYRRAITIQQKGAGEQDPNLAITYHNLAELYADQKNFAQAEAICRESLRISERAFGPTDPRVAAELRALSRLAEAQGRASEKEESAKRAENIASGLPGATPQTVSEGAAKPGRSPTLNPNKPVQDKWALVIGISNFKDPSLNLRYATKDAIDFRNYLVGDGRFRADHVKVLTDRLATRENIVNALGDGWLTRVANSDDLVVIYISSHGSSAKRDIAGVNMLVAYDTNINNQLATGIPMEWLTQIIRDQVHCGRVVLILDVCHSGAAGTASKGLARRFDFDLDKVGVGSGQIVVCSSQSDQVSWESAKYPNSVFTRKLIEGLRRKGANTRLSEAFDFMSEQVEEEVLRDRAVVQTPLLKKIWTGDDLILSVLPAKPRPALTDNSLPVKSLPVKPLPVKPPLPARKGADRSR